MIKTIRILALSLTLGVWATVSVDALNVKQAAQVSADRNSVHRGIVDRANDGTLNLLGSGQQQVITCDGNVVQITGNDGIITLQGTCSEVILVGNSNRIESDTVGAISVTGNENQITWANSLKGSKPLISQSGEANSVTQQE